MADQADRLSNSGGADDGALRPSRGSPRAAADRAGERLDRSPPRPSASSSPASGPIEKATDLGSVQVLKHGNMFLLTDQFGDIHSDSRGLGLYRNDTRLLSCSVIRRRRRAAGRPPGLDRVELPGRDPAHEPDARPQPRRQDPAGPGARRQDARDHPRAARQRRRRCGSGSRSSTSPRTHETGRGRRSSWPTTRPTSSRSAAIPATAAR